MARLRVRLTFPPSLIQEPIVYRLVKDFDIVINIRRADVKADHGWMALELEATAHINISVTGSLDGYQPWKRRVRVPARGSTVHLRLSQRAAAP